MKLSLMGAAELGVYLALATLFGFLSLESDLATPVWSIVLASVGGIVTVMLRRSVPRIAAVLALVLTVFSAAYGTGAETVLMMFTLLRAGVSQRAQCAWAMFGASVASLGLATLVFAFRLRTGPPMLGLALRADAESWPVDWASSSLLCIVAALIATLIGVNIGHRRRHIASLVERAEQLRRERDQQADIIRSQERERISREMHDVIAHSLSVMIALADGARMAAPENMAATQKAVGHIADTGRRTLGEVRRLLESVSEENQSPSDSLLGIEQLPVLIEEFTAAGLPIRFERTGALESNWAVGLTVYRIVQESLTNVLRHARDVREVLVRITLSGNRVTILVEDSSAPASEAAALGRGLVGMRERGAFYDGEVEAGPRDEGGWRVFVRLHLGE